jgi:hypothetical protein
VDLQSVESIENKRIDRDVPSSNVDGNVSSATESHVAAHHSDRQIVVGNGLLHKAPLPGDSCNVAKIRFVPCFHSFGSLVFLPFSPACALSRGDALTRSH